MEKILDRADDVKTIDEGLKNPWRWQWLEETIEFAVGGQNKQFMLSEWVRKLDRPGLAKCILCVQPLSYSNRGRTAIVGHCNSTAHKDKVRANHNQTTLPSTGASCKTAYGIHPMFYNPKTGLPPQQPLTVRQVVPLDDRVANAEAMVLGTVAEHSLPMTMVPVLIELAQELGRDQKALNKLSMDRSTASYKMNYGLKKTFHDETVTNIRSAPFSLNIDESTSTNHKHVLAVLVNYYHPVKHCVVLEHLAAIELIKVNTDAIFTALEDLFAENEIPWSNLVSLFMDSCAVMRGSKNGLEKRDSREKSPPIDRH